MFVLSNQLDSSYDIVEEVSFEVIRTFPQKKRLKYQSNAIYSHRTCKEKKERSPTQSISHLHIKVVKKKNDKKRKIEIQETPIQKKVSKDNKEKKTKKKKATRRIAGKARKIRRGRVKMFRQHSDPPSSYLVLPLISSKNEKCYEIFFPHTPPYPPFFLLLLFLLSATLLSKRLRQFLNH